MQVPQIPEPWNSATTAQLATRLLPPEAAREVVFHTIAAPITVGGPPLAVIFFASPTPSNDGFCERRTYHVSSPADSPNVLTGTQISLGPCARGPDPVFATVQPNTPVPNAKKAMRWLRWAQGAARGSGPLAFELSCVSKLTENPCAAGARAALAKLPLGGTFIVGQLQPYEGGEWSIAVTPTRPPSHYWTLLIRSDVNLKPRIRMTWDVPPPF